MKVISNALGFAFTLALCGCAHVEVRHVSAGDNSIDGIHFYEPTPYLLIADVFTPSTNGGPEKHSMTSSIIYLPDKQREYVVKVKQGWGTVNGSVKLNNGWMLDTFGAQTDSKGPETITAVSGLITAVAGITAKESIAGAAPKPGLYRISIDTNGDVSLIPQPHWKLGD